ncbi:hypothetical protein FGO68_gene15249 [Halteria grandinella]|uniref:Uncharacterized protein n=1 Tax=Halteria grandinella TaxID=5974 RepID=A0A8J8NY09_HALGN|nr:hypothetical protein FGO68_gene15249 [Halteria grandinella]
MLLNLKSSLPVIKSGAARLIPPPQSALNEQDVEDQDQIQGEKQILHSINIKSLRKRILKNKTSRQLKPEEVQVIKQAINIISQRHQPSESSDLPKLVKVNNTASQDAYDTEQKKKALKTQRMLQVFVAFKERLERAKYISRRGKSSPPRANKNRSLRRLIKQSLEREQSRRRNIQTEQESSQMPRQTIYTEYGGDMVRDKSIESSLKVRDLRKKRASSVEQSYNDEQYQKKTIYDSEPKQSPNLKYEKLFRENESYCQSRPEEQVTKKKYKLAKNQDHINSRNLHNRHLTRCCQTQLSNYQDIENVKKLPRLVSKPSSKLQ